MKRPAYFDDMKFAVALLGLLLLLPAARAVPIPGLDDFRAEALRQINAFRQEEGLAPVKLSDDLNAVSLEWARKLAHAGSLTHRTHDDMGGLLALHGWNALNENLFMSSRNAPVTQTIEAWKKSPGHRRNLLQENITLIGLGTATSDQGGFYAVFNGAGL